MRGMSHKLPPHRAADADGRLQRHIGVESDQYVRFLSKRAYARSPHQSSTRSGTPRDSIPIDSSAYSADFRDRFDSHGSPPVEPWDRVTPGGVGRPSHASVSSRAVQNGHRQLFRRCPRAATDRVDPNGRSGSDSPGRTTMNGGLLEIKADGWGCLVKQAILRFLGDFEAGSRRPTTDACAPPPAARPPSRAAATRDAALRHARRSPSASA